MGKKLYADYDDKFSNIMRHVAGCLKHYIGSENMQDRLIFNSTFIHLPTLNKRTYVNLAGLLLSYRTFWSREIRWDNDDRSWKFNIKYDNSWDIIELIPNTEKWYYLIRTINDFLNADYKSFAENYNKLSRKSKRIYRYIFKDIKKSEHLDKLKIDISNFKHTDEELRQYFEHTKLFYFDLTDRIIPAIEKAERLNRFQRFLLKLANIQ